MDEALGYLCMLKLLVYKNNSIMKGIDYVEVEEGLEGGSVTLGRRVGIHLPVLVQLHCRILIYALRLR